MTTRTIRTLTLPAPAHRPSLVLEVAANGWTRVRLSDVRQTLLGADSFYDVVSRLMAAMSDPAQAVNDLGGGVMASLVMTLPEAHHSIWVERAGGNHKTLHIQNDRSGVNIICRIELDQQERRLWRAALVELVAWAHAEELPL